MPELDDDTDELPVVQYGDKPPADWRDLPEDNDPDDEELAETPADVIAILGFDPLELERDDAATLSKEDAGYQGEGSEAEHCGKCTMFHKAGTCTLVIGDISASAVCDYFELDADKADAVWEETKHPRGQPANKGQFSSAPGGGGSKTERKEPPRLAEPFDPDRLEKISTTAKKFVDTLYLDPEEAEVFAYSRAKSDKERFAALKSAFDTADHVDALSGIFSKGSDERRQLSDHFMAAAKAPQKLTEFVVKREAKEWSAAVDCIKTLVSGSKCSDEHIAGLHRVGIKVFTMVGVSALTGTLPEWTTAAAFGAIASEYVTHAVAEHSAKFGAAAIKMLMGRREDAADDDNDNAMSLLLSWLSDSVASTDLTELFDQANLALEE